MGTYNDGSGFFTDVTPTHIPADGDYTTDIAAVKEELVYARRLFTLHGWPVIDVTRRSIEETAAAVLNVLARRRAG